MGDRVTDVRQDRKEKYAVVGKFVMGRYGKASDEDVRRIRAMSFESASDFACEWGTRWLADRFFDDGRRYRDWADVEGRPEVRRHWQRKARDANRRGWEMRGRALHWRESRERREREEGRELLAKCGLAAQDDTTTEEAGQ